MSLIQEKVQRARAFFASGKTLDITFRQEQLQKLYDALQKRLPEVEAALKADLNKSPFEGYLTETSIVLGEIRYMKAHLASWAKPRRVPAAMNQLPARVRLHPEPYGVCLVMSPWNYPIQLTLVPVVCALAAGNTVVVKPSIYSPESSHFIRSLLEESLEPGLVSVIEGGREENQGLLHERFDYIFFTGSPRVAHVVMESAAKNLTPMTLELGGKSPVIVEESADLKLAAKRLAFGKLCNAGQTCVAPDHVYVQRSVKEAFLQEFKASFGSVTQDPAYFRDMFPRIINQKHFERLLGYLEGQTILMGGESWPDRLQIAPTILDEAPEDSPVMQEEIFGPIMPVIAYDDFDELIARQKQKEKPLALYHFTRNAEHEAKVVRELSYGGGCVNDTLLHIISPHSPFGGVGRSGMGQYHGRFGFETFSHLKTVLKKGTFGDLALRYPPFKEKNLSFLKKLLH